MSNRPSWAQDLPLPPDDVRTLSERAIQLAMAEQLTRQIGQRNHWHQVLAPREDISAERYASAFHGPYRRRRLRRAGRILRGAAVWLVFIAAGLVVGVGFSALAGCSPASDSRIDELIALDLADAVAQAQQQERPTTTAYQFRGAAQMAKVSRRRNRAAKR